MQSLHIRNMVWPGCVHVIQNGLSIIRGIFLEYFIMVKGSIPPGKKNSPTKLGIILWFSIKKY